MTISTSMLRMVKRVIARDGGSGSIVRETRGEYDTELGTAPVVVTTTPVKFLFFDFQKVVNGQQAVDGTLIDASDKEVYIDPTGVTSIVPKMDMFVDANGIKWAIKNIKKHCPNGVDVIMYMLTLKR